MICVPLRLKNFSTLLKQVVSAQKIGDVVEVWPQSLSSVSPEQVKQLAKIKRRPFLLKFEGDINLLRLWKDLAIDYIDIDLSTSQKVIREIKQIFPRVSLIVSHHDFVSTPSEKKLRSILLKMSKMGADIKKIAVTTNKFSEALFLLSLARELSLAGEKVIFIGMGKNGRITRTAGHLCGNYLMYCPLSEKQKTAPGQFTAEELKKLWI